MREVRSAVADPLQGLGSALAVLAGGAGTSHSSAAQPSMLRHFLTLTQRGCKQEEVGYCGRTEGLSTIELQIDSNLCVAIASPIGVVKNDANAAAMCERVRRRCGLRSRRTYPMINYEGNSGIGNSLGRSVSIFIFQMLF